MKKVAITGGIGSGKSTVCKLFNELGVPVFNTDESARSIRANHEEAKAEIFEIFKTHDDKEIAMIAFSDKEKLKAITDIMSRYVIAEYNLFCENNVDKPYTILETAILIELKIINKFDYIISVIADEEVRVDRVIKRNNTTKDEVLKRIRQQSSNIEMIEISDFIIQNNDNSDIEGTIPQSLTSQVNSIDEYLKTQ